MSDAQRLKTRLAELLASASVSSTQTDVDMGNIGVINKLAEWLEDLDFTASIQPLDGKPNKANLIAQRGSGPGGLVLSGHTDTVPYNEGRWHSDPLKLTEKDQRWYGLGATDMKGFFPVALAAIEQFREQDLQAPIIVLATADEESSMDGARALVTAGLPKARYAVIGEPTGLRPIHMHKGMMMEAVTVQGRAGHSSNPALGNSALEAMHDVMAEILRFRGELQTRWQHPGFTVNVPTLNLGCIHGGDNPNRICNECELHFDLRALPGMDNDEVREQLRSRLRGVAEQRGVNISLRSLMAGVAAFEQAPDAELIAAAEEFTGLSADSVAYATEAPFMQQLGMQTVVLGPGSIDQAHQSNEYIELAQIQPAIDIYSQLIRRFCL